MNNLPKEILILIFEYLSIKQLIKMELVNKKFKKIIRENKWTNLKNIAQNPKPKNLEKFIINHNFANYKSSEISDNLLKFLGNYFILL